MSAQRQKPQERSPRPEWEWAPWRQIPEKRPPPPSFEKELKLSGLGLTRERRVLAPLIRAACKPDPFKRPAPEPTLSGAKWAQSANMW